MVVTLFLYAPHGGDCSNGLDVCDCLCKVRDAGQKKSSGTTLA